MAEGTTDKHSKYNHTRISFRLILSRSVISDVFPCFVVPVELLCIFLIYLRIFPVADFPILTDRTYFDAQAARGDISFEQRFRPRCTGFLIDQSLGIGIPADGFHWADIHASHTSDTERIFKYLIRRNLCCGKNRGKTHAWPKLFCQQCIIDTKISQAGKVGGMLVGEECDGFFLENGNRSVPVSRDRCGRKSIFIKECRDTISVLVKQGIDGTVEFMVPDGWCCFNDRQGDRQTDNNDGLCFRKDCLWPELFGDPRFEGRFVPAGSPGKTDEGYIQISTFPEYPGFQRPAHILTFDGVDDKGFWLVC